MLVRHFFRRNGLNDEPIGYLVLAGLIVTLILQVFYVIKQAILAAEMHRDPDLEEALNNELVRSLEIYSWRAAYIGACATTLFFAFISSFYPICDTVTIALTTIIVGAGAHRATFYFKYKAL
jgi:hypothetical protein